MPENTNAIPELNSLSLEVSCIPQVGETRARLLGKLGIRTIGDLLEFFPRDYINRRMEVKIRSLAVGTRASLIGVILQIEKRRTKSAREQLNVVVSDGRDALLCTWFQFQKWIVEAMVSGKRIWVAGMVSEYQGRKQIVHPEFEVFEDERPDNFWHNRSVLPVYPLTENLRMNTMRNLILSAFKKHRQSIREVLPEALLMKYHFLPREEAIRLLHFPPDESTAVAQIHERFVYEELFFHQLMLARCNLIYHRAPVGNAFTLRKTLTTRLKTSLAFTLTRAQKRVINEIVADMTSNRQMHRLLQGDVGSGKTIVTLFAMLIAVENGFQAALMAPTELLAEQHYRSISRFLENQPEVKVALLKGGNYRGKKEIKEAVAEGGYDLIIGTHALLQKDLRFHKLGFVAIDEQHRFGVMQRALLAGDEQRPDVLHLSATPIPRSLAMTFFGDLEISVLDELPPTRKPVLTRACPKSRAASVFEEIRNELGQGRQVYIVCPLVEESEKLDLLDAETLFKDVREHWLPGVPAAILHGRMKTAEKDEIMTRFKEGDLKVLVSTTVIEVGIDVPNASAMVIWNAERFGLAQLHQLRGRVGRGTAQSQCWLVHAPMGGEARMRLDALVQSNDGFLIAEKDLDMRGAGDFFGTRQAGMPAFRHADIVRDQNWLKLAREDAFAVASMDRELKLPEHRMLARHYQQHYRQRESLFPY